MRRRKEGRIRTNKESTRREEEEEEEAMPWAMAMAMDKQELRK